MLSDTLLGRGIIAALTVPLLAFSPGLARWNGDNLGGNNNPPTKNLDLPAGIANLFVRVNLNWVVEGVSKSELASGIVIGFKRDSADSETGRVCVLTAAHNVALPSDFKGKFYTRSFAFGDQGSNYPNIIADSGVLRRIPHGYFPYPAQRGVRPDLAILVGTVTDWDKQVPKMLTPAAVAAEDGSDLLLAGFGNTGRVDTENRRYYVVKGYGTLRSGTAKVKAVEEHTDDSTGRDGSTYTFKAIKSLMEFRPLEAKASTSASAFFLNGDSGGPTLQKQGDSYKLVGIHSESHYVSGQGEGDYVREDNPQWDVRTQDYAEWINKTCMLPLPLGPP